MRGKAAIFLLVLMAAPAFAYDAYDPKNCNGMEWDGEHTPVVAKVTGKSALESAAVE